MSALTNLIRTVAGLIAGVLAVGILLVVLNADEENRIVSAVLDVGRFFQDPFGRMFDLERGKEHLQIAINWGIAAAVYLAVGIALATLLRAVASRAGR